MKCLLLPIAVKSNTPLHSMLLCIRLCPLIPILLGSLIQSTDANGRRHSRGSQPGHKLERCNNSAFVFFVNELLNLGRTQSIHQLLDFRTVFVTLADSNDVSIRRFLRLGKQRILNRIQLSFHSEVGVDNGQIGIIHGTRQQSSFDFHNLQLFVIANDIAYGSLNANAILQLQQLSALQQSQRTAAVGRVVRNSDFCTFRVSFRDLIFLE